MKDIRVGIVGVGTISAQHLSARLALGVEVVTWSIDDSNTLVLAIRHGGERVAGSLKELLDADDIATAASEYIRRGVAVTVRATNDEEMAA